MKLKYYIRGLGVGMAVTALILQFAPDNDKRELTDSEIIARAEALGMVRSVKLGDLERKSLSADMSGEPKDEEEAVRSGAVSKNSLSDDAVSKDSVSGDESVSESEAEEESAAAKKSKVTPTAEPTATTAPEPTATQKPTATPTVEPTATPKPTATPTQKPTAATPKPTATPTPKPTATPTPKPTATPTPKPTATPTVGPTATPAPKPTATPTPKPTATPTPAPVTASTISGYVSFTVYNGEGSYAVAKRLKDAGIISSAAEFDNYLCENGYDRQLKAGVHDIPENGDFKGLADALMQRGR